MTHANLKIYEYGKGEEPEDGKQYAAYLREHGTFWDIVTYCKSYSWMNGTLTGPGLAPARSSEVTPFMHGHFILADIPEIPQTLDDYLSKRNSLKEEKSELFRAIGLPENATLFDLRAAIGRIAKLAQLDPDISAVRETLNGVRASVQTAIDRISMPEVLDFCPTCLAKDGEPHGDLCPNRGGVGQ